MDYQNYGKILFQSTRPRGARQKAYKVCKVYKLVSIHAPARGATQYAYIQAAIYGGFNPRARAGRDMQPNYPSIRIDSFNPRARAGRDSQNALCIYLALLFQSTRPRGARHKGGNAMFNESRVSIHAPARGATRADWIVRNKAVQFQSTRAARGADECEPRHCSSTCWFQPRARAGRDPMTTGGRRWTTLVSIHAPAGGATRRCTRI
jgi:hypothetical protein